MGSQIEPNTRQPRSSTQAPPAKNSDERRRTQIRTAQRAYRARNQATVIALKRRLAQLENALEEISKGVVSLSDSMVQLQVLNSYPQIADGLRETVETCLALARYSEEDEKPAQGQENVDYSRHDEESRESRESRQRSLYNKGIPPSPILPNIYFRTSTEGLDAAWFTRNPFPFRPEFPGAATMGIPAFIEHIRIACLYHGFRILNDPSIPVDILARPFRLLLPLVPRDTIATFFQSRLHARLAKAQPERHSEIPFFHLGGAGTHYRDGFISNAKRNEQYPQYAGYSIIDGDGPLSAFSPPIREELDGEWFDLNDLEGYLLEKRVCLVMVASTATGSELEAVNAVHLTAELLRKAICLGHSPGFRRRDVEAAINSPRS
ncbi:hypothetical protein BDV12DRAFT_196062 [Aspergillus spectabilis]